jgi:peptidoglycan L-alanyl-D-glutamate endopeptidase CwlK
MGTVHHRERADGVHEDLIEWLDFVVPLLNFDTLITAGVRTAAEQEELYAQGRTKPGNVVTHSHAAQSAHCHGGAVDIAPFIHGAIPWDKKDPGYELWPQIGASAGARGLGWGGCGTGGWTHFVDRPHIEVAFWQQLPLIP